MQSRGGRAQRPRALGKFDDSRGGNENGDNNGDHGGGFFSGGDVGSNGTPNDNNGDPTGSGGDPGGGSSTSVGGINRIQESGGSSSSTGVSTVSTPASGQSTLLPAVTSTQNTLTSSPIALSSTSTGGSSNKLSTNRVQPSISSSSTPRSTASVLYNADSSGGTSTVSIGVPPNGTSGIASTKPGSNAGVIAGTVIFSVFILLIFAFLLHRRRVRNRIAPSAQYLAEYGPRPLSWAPAFFSRRASSGYYDISHFNISSIWQGPNSQSGHSIATGKQSQSLSGHSITHRTEDSTHEPEMRQSQSPVGRMNMHGSPGQSISGHSSIGAAVGHSPVPDDPFADNLEAQLPAVPG